MYRPQDIYLMENSVVINATLADCIRHHHLLIKCGRLLENIASPFILVKSIEISFQICVLALTFMKVFAVHSILINMKFSILAMQTTGSVAANMNTAQYLGLTLFDLYMISYLGQIIQDQV